MLERVIPKGGSSGTTSSTPRWYTSRTTVLALFPVPAVTVTFARGISSGLSLIPGSHREARIIRCLRDTPRLVGKHTPRILIRRDGNHPRPSGRLEDERFGRLDGEGRRSRLWLLLPAILP